LFVALPIAIRIPRHGQQQSYLRARAQTGWSRKSTTPRRVCLRGGSSFKQRTLTLPLAQKSCLLQRPDDILARPLLSPTTVHTQYSPPRSSSSPLNPSPRPSSPSIPPTPATSGSRPHRRPRPRQTGSLRLRPPTRSSLATGPHPAHSDRRWTTLTFPLVLGRPALGPATKAIFIHTAQPP